MQVAHRDPSLLFGNHSSSNARLICSVPHSLNSMIGVLRNLIVSRTSQNQPADIYHKNLGGRAASRNGELGFHLQGGINLRNLVGRLDRLDRKQRNCSFIYCSEGGDMGHTHQATFSNKFLCHREWRWMQMSISGGRVQAKHTRSTKVEALLS